MTTNHSKDKHFRQTCKFQCLQGNMRCSKVSLLTLMGDIADKTKYPQGIDVLFLTEPPTVTKSNTLSDIPDDIYNCFMEKSGRAALVTKGFTSWRCPQFCARNIVVCQAKLNDSITYLVSMYMDQNIQDFPKEFKDLISKCGNANILIGTDSNSHCTVWNCTETDKRGEFIEDFVIENNLSCLNVGNNWTFESAHGFKSIIDVTLANYRLASKISDWRVENHLQVSDHYRITFTINDCINFRAEERLDWNYKKGDWNVFKTVLDDGLRNWTGSRIWSDVTIEYNLESFLTELYKALEIACPKKWSKHKFKYPMWWDDNLTHMRSKLRKYSKIKTPEGKTLYITLRREYKKAIRKAKNDGWKEFTSNIKYPSEVSKLIKSFNNNKNNSLGLLKNQEGEYCDNPKESLNILLKKKNSRPYCGARNRQYGLYKS